MFPRAHTLPEDAIIEDVVSSTILSFSSEDFLYTGTVCKSWRQNRGEDTRTSILAALRSCCRLEEAFASGMHKSNVLDIAIVFNADVSVLRHISKDPAADRSSRVCIMNYAAFVGNLDAVALMHPNIDDFGLDEGHLFDAVRGGHIDVVKHIVAALTPDEINKLPVWRSGWAEYNDIRGVVNLVAGSAYGFEGVAKSIELFFGDDDLRWSPTRGMSCIDAAITRNRLDIVRVLREAGAVLSRGEYPVDSTQLALATCNIEMMQYLKNEGLRMDGRTLFDAIKTNNREMIQFILDAGCLVPNRGEVAMFFSREYFHTVEASVPIIEFVLDKHLVEVDDLRIRSAMLNTENRPVVDMLLSRGYSVEDDTVDDAIEAWDFDFAERLMRVYGRIPTAAAYKCLVLQGFHYSGAEFEHLDFAVCLERLEWLHSLGCPVGFETFADMQRDMGWAFVFAEMASYNNGDVQAFFRARLPG